MALVFEHAAPLLSLPPEILAIVCSFCTLSESFGAFLSCKTLHDLLFTSDASVHVWDAYFGSHFGERRRGHGFSTKDSFYDRHRIALSSSRFSESLNKRVHRGPAMFVQYDPTGARILSCGHDRRLVITSATGAVEHDIRQVSADKLMAAAPLWSRDKVIVVGSGGGAVFRISEPTKPLFTVSHDSEWVLSAAAPSTGHMFVTCGYDNTAKAWSIEDGDYLGCIARHSDRIVCCALLGDNYLLTGSNDKSVCLWDVTSLGLDPIPIRSYKAHSNFVNTIATGCVASSSAIQNTFVSGGYDGLVASWDVRSKDPTATVKSPHPGTVGSAAIYSDAVLWSCGTAVTCSSLFDLRQRWYIPKAHENAAQIWSISVHPFGRSFLTSCNTGVVKQWTLSPRDVP